MWIEYHLLEIAAIVIFLGSGAFLIYDSLTQPAQSTEVIGGSVLLVLGGILAGVLARALLRQVQQDTRHE
jgi:hypothetical protein